MDDRDNVQGVMFEGIATIDLDGVAHDTYMTVHLETVGYMVRWLGSFGWMGEAPKGVFHGEEVDVVLSDGREGRIKIPHPGGEDGKVEFLGIGMPPGFTWVQAEVVTTELKSSTPARRRFASMAFGLGSLATLATSFWVSGRAIELAGTAFCLIVAAIAFMPPRVKMLPEVPDDCPHQ